MRKFGVFCLLSLMSVGLAEAACEDSQVFVVDSGKAYSTSDRGASANSPVQCFAARSDEYIVESSISMKKRNGAGHKQQCRTSGNREYINISTKDVNGNQIEFRGVKKFCMYAHAETGSGVSKITSTAWIKCNVLYRSCEIN
ncbi:hypothetical protein [Roseibium sp. TrichSKD4]|uniref:hypothetical protein n=1 Tax=Roseibium sp. TrichSKD4 TaxID=744980 RepID=UPI0011127443|nr:hypothetical protein [Roseibium sp. TrichSKD4]